VDAAAELPVPLDEDGDDAAEELEELEVELEEELDVLGELGGGVTGSNVLLPMPKPIFDA